jgi:hypothetical protein
VSPEREELAAMFADRPAEALSSTESEAVPDESGRAVSSSHAHAQDRAGAISEQAVDAALAAGDDWVRRSRPVVFTSPSRDQVRAMLEGARPAMAATLQAEVETAFDVIAAERFADTVRAATDRLLVEKLTAIEAAVRANERARIRRGVLAREMVLRHPEDGDRVAVLTLDLEQIIGAEDGT